MGKVRLTITESRCRGGYCKKGDVFEVEDVCPPLCHELWHGIYPFVYALQNGAESEALRAEELAGVRVDGRELMLAVMETRRMLSANVAWPNALDALYFSLVDGKS